MKLRVATMGLTLLTLIACSNAANSTHEPEAVDLPQSTSGVEIATFAGGCFWCTEAVFERVKGVEDVVSGYAGGSKETATYEQIGSGTTKHAESIQIKYDPSVVSFETLLEVFFKGAHDPTTLNRQGPDVGPQYRSVVFYHSPSQQKATEKMIASLNEKGIFADKIVTQVVPYEAFYPAEPYHQDYYPNHPENPYVQRVTKPKVEKFEKKFQDLLKENYRH